jgi:hypothetical protein
MFILTINFEDVLVLFFKNKKKIEKKSVPWGELNPGPLLALNFKINFESVLVLFFNSLFINSQI